MRPDLVDDVIKRPRVNLESAPSVILTYMLINNHDPVLKDTRVRQALALAIDRDGDHRGEVLRPRRARDGPLAADALGVQRQRHEVAARRRAREARCSTKPGFSPTPTASDCGWCTRRARMRFASRSRA